MRRIRSILIVAICGLSGPLVAAETSAEARIGPHGGEASGWYKGDRGRARCRSLPDYQHAIIFAEDKDGVSFTNTLAVQVGDEQIGSTMSLNIGSHGSSSSGGLVTTFGQQPSVRVGSMARPRQSESYFEARGSVFQGTTWARDR